MFLRKYNTSSQVCRVSLYKAGTQDFATSTDWTPETGDVKIAKDGGTQANAGTLPSFVNGAWEFPLSAGELTAKVIEVTIVDSATKAVADARFDVETFGHSSAQYPAILNAGTAGNPAAAGDGMDLQTVKTRSVADPGSGNTVYHPTAAYGGKGGVAILDATTGSKLVGYGGINVTLGILADVLNGYDQDNTLRSHIDTRALTTDVTTLAGGFTLADISTAIAAINDRTANANISGTGVLEIPDSGTVQYPFTLVIRDSNNALCDLDAAPTITVTNAAGTSRSGNLSTITHASTGVYTYTYGAAYTAAAEGLRMLATGAVGGSSRRADKGIAVVDYDHGTLLAAINSAVTGPNGNAALAAALATLTGRPSPLTGVQTTAAVDASSCAENVLVILGDDFNGAYDSLHELRQAISAVGTVSLTSEQLAVIAAGVAAAVASAGGSALGSGADRVTIPITVNGTAVADCQVWISSDSAGNHVVAGTLSTKSDGRVTFLLDAGDTYYLWAQKDGINPIEGRMFTAVAD